MQKAETTHVRMTLRRAALFALGWILVLGGFLGLFLPVVPGAVLILAGNVCVTHVRSFLFE
jgi:uncharacterized membrane protein YbaN (DUF454 family)